MGKVKDQTSRSEGHVTYQQPERYNYMECRINFKLGENFHREVCSTWQWHTFWESGSVRQL